MLYETQAILRYLDRVRADAAVGAMPRRKLRRGWIRS